MKVVRYSQVATHDQALIVNGHPRVRHGLPPKRLRKEEIENLNLKTRERKGG
jgi:hypothetical protein